MRIIDVDEVKKRYPIMENDFGMVINETLHKELDKIPTVEAISKVDMMAILDKLKGEIEQLPTHLEYPDIECIYVTKKQLLEIIDKYKTESEEGKK